MNRQILTIWIAGLMVGSGSGLIIARSVPGSQHSATAANSSQSNVDTSNGNRGLYPDFLSDPRKLPSHRNQIENFNTSENVKSENIQPEQQTFEPRLLPEGEASPVQKEEPQITVKKPTSLEFQNELKEIGPELSEEALNDLAKIWSQIENEKPEKETKP